VSGAVIYEVGNFFASCNSHSPKPMKDGGRSRLPNEAIARNSVQVSFHRITRSQHRASSPHGAGSLVPGRSIAISKYMCAAPRVGRAGGEPVCKPTRYIHIPYPLGTLLILEYHSGRSSDMQGLLGSR